MRRGLILLIAAIGLAALPALVSLAAQPAMAAKTENTRGFGKRANVVRTPFVNGTYRALIIGNDKYKDPKRVWVPLKTAVNDARAVAKVLKEDYGFAKITLLIDGTRRQMIQAFNKIAKESEENDSVLIYYAGHGYLKEDTQEGYWIPVDAEGADDSTFIANPTIKTKLSIIADRAKHVMLISDSCFSGALLRAGNRGVNLDEKTIRYYQKVAARKSVQILAAGGLEFVDDNYKGTGHSPFTYYLLEALKTPGTDLVEGTELFADVTRNVAINVNQTPEKGVLAGAGHAGGEFFFIRSGSDAGKMFTASRGAGGAATGPKEQPRAFVASAAVAALTSPAAIAAGGGAMSSVALYSGSGLLLVSALQFSAAMSAHSAATDTAESDPEASANSEKERDAAFSTSMITGLAGIGMMSWWYWGFDDDDGYARTNSWNVAPIAVNQKNGAAPGLFVYRRW